MIMNIRNLRIFGLKELIPKELKGKHILFTIFIIVIIALAFFFVTKDRGKVSYEDVTVIPREEFEKSLQPEQEISEQAEEQTTGNESTEEVEPEEQVKETEQEENRSYYEYKEQCARDLKTAEDDIAELNAYISGYQQAYDNLTAELNEKFRALEDEYNIDLSSVKEDIKNNNFEFKRIREKINTAKTNLEEAQKKYNEIKAKCDKEFYS